MPESTTSPARKPRPQGVRRKGERLAQGEAQIKADEAAAKATGAAAEKSPKGWMGGLEDWAKRLQEGAFGSKDKTPQDQLAEQKLQTALLAKIHGKLNVPMPAAIGP